MASPTQTQAALLPIAEISTYQNRFTVKARVTNKSQVRTFQRGSVPGRVFSVDLLDREGGEIRASIFNQGVDAFFEMLQVGKCFTFSRGSVKVANKQFNNTNHRYEITFDKDALIAEAEEDTDILQVKFSFTDLRAVQSKTLPAKADLCAVVVSAMPVHSFTSRDGKELVKRELTIADESSLTMDVTLWGDRAKEADAKFAGQPVMAFKGVFVKEWNGGRAGSLLQDGHLEFEPKGPEADRMRQWWSKLGGSQNLTALSVKGGGGGAAVNAKSATFAELRQAAEALGDKPEVFSVVARLALVQMTKQGEPQPLTYVACNEVREGSSLTCNKRLDESGFCPSCNRAGKAAVRMNTRCRFLDFQDGVWLTTFHEAAQQVLGLSAERLRELEQEAGARGDREALEARLKAAYFAPLQLTVRAKLDSYQGETRTNITCIGASPVQPVERSRKMLGEIQQMLAA